MGSILRQRFQKCIEMEGLKIYSVADAIEVERSKLYNFSSQETKICNDEAIRLHKFLKDRGY